MARKLFCQLSPFATVSRWKRRSCCGICGISFPGTLCRAQEEEPLPALIKGHRSPMLRQLAGVDMQLQYNKETNLRLAGERIHGLSLNQVRPFPFWHTVGPHHRPEGYLPGADHRGWAAGS